MSGLFDQLVQKAKESPQKKALIKPRRSVFSLHYHYDSLSFEELVRRCLCYETELKNLKVCRGMRTLVFVRPGFELAPLTFALFKIGAVPVFIDPGMGKENLLACIEKARPEAMVAEGILALVQKLYPKSFRSVKLKVYTRRSWYFHPQHALSDFLKRDVPSLSELPDVSKKAPGKDDLAALLFTSGGTGIPKGVRYTHRIFETQTRMLQKMFNLTNEDIDCPGFPLFSLFTLSMGASNALPDMDATKPAKCNPKRLIQNIVDQNASFVAGSPAIWERVADECLRQGVQLPTVKSVVMFGAPVSLELHQKFKKILPHGTTYTPYGATEALPVALTSGNAILNGPDQKMRTGLGTYLGRPVPGVKVKIIEISDEAKSEIQEVPTNTLGEIIVQGENVTQNYDGMPEQTQRAKIITSSGLWHRMGDVGFLDEKDELWFCGRKSHRVLTTNQTLYSVPCEAIFNQHPEVKRTALIGPLKEQNNLVAGLVIELKKAKKTSAEKRVKIIQELKELGAQYPHTREVQKFYFATSFPVDVRHNIKIDRPLLKSWAEKGRLT